MQALSPVRLDVHDVDCYRVICLVHASNYCKTMVLEIDWNLVALTSEKTGAPYVRGVTTTISVGEGTREEWDCIVEMEHVLTAGFFFLFLFVNANMILWDKIDGMNLWSELDVLLNRTRGINGKLFFFFFFQRRPRL